jgi:hypothetical protein
MVLWYCFRPSRCGVARCVDANGERRERRTRLDDENDRRMRPVVICTGRERRAYDGPWACGMVAGSNSEVRRAVELTGCWDALIDNRR